MNTLFEKNSLICKFLNPEATIVTEDDFLSNYDIEDGEMPNLYVDASLKYQSDWNQLHEVVDAIENLSLGETDNCFNVTIGSGLYCTIQDAYGVLIEINTCEETKIKTVYEAVVEFIELYNAVFKTN